MFYYLDQAATTALYPEALKAMMPYLTEAYGNPSSQHPKGQEAARALIMAREQAACALSVHPSEITFTGGGSESDNQALITGAHIGAQKGKRHLISTVMEHHAVLHSLRRLKEEGFEVTLLPISKDGFVSPESVKKALRPDTALVSVMAANNEIGTIQPIEAIGTLCHEKGVLFHTDAVQGAAHMDLDFTKGVIDMASFSAHKFHGPKGVGILYARQGIELESLIEGGAQERGKRAGTENIPAIVGMAAALEKAMQEKAAESARIRSLKERLRKNCWPLKACGKTAPFLPAFRERSTLPLTAPHQKPSCPYWAWTASVFRQAPPVLPAHRNLPMCFLPWGFQPNRPARPSGSVLVQTLTKKTSIPLRKLSSVTLRPYETCTMLTNKEIQIYGPLQKLKILYEVSLIRPS